uniref:Uncharacterized protein n=1 Tax=Rhizophora mucronata TaxID=61149 RepID=A0A2P2J0I7_RHIMU
MKSTISRASYTGLIHIIQSRNQEDKKKKTNIKEAMYFNCKNTEHRQRILRGQ